MSDFRERLLSLWGSEEKPSKIAADIGMSLPGFMRVYNEGFIPKADGLIKIQEFTGCNLTWLLTGKGNQYETNNEIKKYVTSDILDTLGNPVDLDNFVFIPRYEVYASAGNGHAVYDENPRFPMAFRTYWIKNYIGADPADLSVITVKGDSMQGVLDDKDIILINHSKITPREGIYVMRINNELIVKRLQMMPHGIVKVSSANDVYEPFEVNFADESTGIQVIGKVVWLGRAL